MPVIPGPGLWRDSGHPGTFARRGFRNPGRLECTDADQVMLFAIRTSLPCRLTGPAGRTPVVLHGTRTGAILDRHRSPSPPWQCGLIRPGRRRTLSHQRASRVVPRGGSCRRASRSQVKIALVRRRNLSSNLPATTPGLAFRKQYQAPGLARRSMTMGISRSVLAR